MKPSALSRSINNIGLLFNAQVFGYLIPLVEIPILARSLGAEGYAKVVVIQSAALLASLFMEYGFGISATRQIACVKDDRKAITSIYADVLSAKIMVAVVIMTLAICAIFLLRLEVDMQHIFYGLLYFLAFGLSPMWLFHGLERLTHVLAVELVLRSAGVVVLFLSVKEEDDAGLALGILASFAFFNTFVSSLMSLVWLDRFWLSFQGGWVQLRDGFHMFVYKGTNNILMSSGPALIAFVSGVQALASYVPAEKIVKGLIGIASPLLAGIFPLINRSFMPGARPQLFLSLFVSTSLMLSGVAAAVAVSYAGERLITVILGEGFSAATDVIKLLVWIVPLRMANQSLALTFLIPMNKDKLVGTLTLLSSLVAILSVICFGTLYGALGAAAGFILAEALLFLMLIGCVGKACLVRHRAMSSSDFD